MITFAPSKHNHLFIEASACTYSPPEEGVTSLVIRLGNPRADGLNQTNSVQNEVASIYLARHGTGIASAVFPPLYDWQRSTLHPDGHSSMGSILKHGVALDPALRWLVTGMKQSITDQIIEAFFFIQRSKHREQTNDDAKGRFMVNICRVPAAKFLPQLGDTDGILTLRGCGASVVASV
ncbi:hypothetical protein BR93DRAFT_924653 [Coniochaeta sp. PMI_546]|nr:hypothetical protein BR93DRAFT_924653 [Coniochaeta sp. PMI_546]